VPQFKYKVGKTFGCHTHELLTSAEPEVASSGQLVLSSIEPDGRNKSGKEVFSQPIYHGRSRSWGDYKYVPEMVPGYTGWYTTETLNEHGLCGTEGLICWSPYFVGDVIQNYFCDVIHCMCMLSSLNERLLFYLFKQQCNLGRNLNSFPHHSSITFKHLFCKTVRGAQPAFYNSSFSMA